MDDRFLLNIEEDWLDFVRAIGDGNGEPKGIAGYRGEEGIRILRGIFI